MDTFPLDAIHEIKSAAAYGLSYNLSSVPISVRALTKIIEYMHYEKAATEFDENYYAYRKKQLEDEIKELEEKLKDTAEITDILIKFNEKYPNCYRCGDY